MAVSGWAGKTERFASFFVCRSGMLVAVSLWRAVRLFLCAPVSDFLFYDFICTTLFCTVALFDYFAFAFPDCFYFVRHSLLFPVCLITLAWLRLVRAFIGSLRLRSSRLLGFLVFLGLFPCLDWSAVPWRMIIGCMICAVQKRSGFWRKGRIADSPALFIATFCRCFCSYARRCPIRLLSAHVLSLPGAMIQTAYITYILYVVMPSVALFASVSDKAGLSARLSGVSRLRDMHVRCFFITGAYAAKILLWHRLL